MSCVPTSKYLLCRGPGLYGSKLSSLQPHGYTADGRQSCAPPRGLPSGVESHLRNSDFTPGLFLWVDSVHLTIWATNTKGKENSVFVPKETTPWQRRRL